MGTVISVENLSKKYIIGHQKQRRYTALRDVLANGAKRFADKLRHPFAVAESDPTHEEFWALKDVSFKIQQGDRVGIIGRNGAGKSTLLKTLSRITEPTSGKIKIRGRVASLLEVGTGFHPELTGRENIYLNGAILGMSRVEIRKKFEEIVAFADVEKFLDTAVKHYSSGMHMRLAFSVAAHLEPEILIVDEVLAVGDAQFQKKCLGKMQSVSKDGRTILFVSHSMEAISTFCTRGIMLNQGSVEYDGSAAGAINVYIDRNRNQDLSQNFSSRGGSGGARIQEIFVRDENQSAVTQVLANQAITLSLKALLEPSYQDQKILDIGFGIDSLEGERLVTLVASWSRKEILSNGESLIVLCHIPFLPLIPGDYLVSASISFLNDTLDCVINCVQFTITNEQDGSFANRLREHGKMNIPCKFEYLAEPVKRI